MAQKLTKGAKKMIKVLLAKAKIYLMIAVLAGAVIGTWKVRGWYQDGLVNDALIEQAKKYEALAIIDDEALVKALAEQEQLRNAYEGLKSEANKTKLCANGGNDFLRLFNRSAITSNKKK